jgi:YVTN family beta-propeller protein
MGPRSNLGGAALFLAGLAAAGAGCHSDNTAQGTSAAFARGPENMLAIGAQVFNTHGGATVARANGILALVDIATKGVVACVPLSINDPWDVKVTPDGRKAYVTDFSDEDGSGSGVIAVVDLVRRQQATTISVGTNSEAFGIAIAPDGSRAYVTSNASGNAPVYIIDTSTDSVAGTIPNVGSGGIPAITPDGSLLYVPITENGNLTHNLNGKIISTASNEVVGTAVGAGTTSQVAAAAASPDGATFWATAEDNEGFAAYFTQEPFERIHDVSNVNNSSAEEGGGVDFGPDGTVYIAVSSVNNEDAAVLAVDPNSATVIATYSTSLFESGTPRVHVNPDNTQIYLTSENSSALVIFDRLKKTQTTIPITGATGIAGYQGSLGFPASNCFAEVVAR